MSVVTAMAAEAAVFMERAARRAVLAELAPDAPIATHRGSRVAGAAENPSRRRLTTPT